MSSGRPCFQGSADLRWCVIDRKWQMKLENKTERNNKYIETGRKEARWSIGAFESVGAPVSQLSIRPLLDSSISRQYVIQYTAIIVSMQSASLLSAIMSLRPSVLWLSIGFPWNWRKQFPTNYSTTLQPVSTWPNLFIFRSAQLIRLRRVLRVP